MTTVQLKIDNMLQLGGELLSILASVTIIIITNTLHFISNMQNVVHLSNLSNFSAPTNVSAIR